METRHPSLASARDSVLVLIDCQERLWKVIHEKDTLEKRLQILLQGASILGVPVLVTEQNPQGLGPTIPSLRQAAPDAPVLAKASFSCCGDDAFRAALRSLDRGTLVLCGIETHICVLQTGHDALASGHAVQVVADACGTRLPHNQPLGLDRLGRAGAGVTAVESVLFEWMERCDAAAFKRVIGLLR